MKRAGTGLRCGAGNLCGGADVLAGTCPVVFLPILGCSVQGLSPSPTLDTSWVLQVGTGGPCSQPLMQGLQSPAALLSGAVCSFWSWSQSSA